MRDPSTWIDDPGAANEMAKMLEAAQTVGPTAAQKAALATQLGVTSGVAWSVPTLLKSFLVLGAIAGSGAVAWQMSESGEPRGTSTEAVVQQAATTPTREIEVRSAEERTPAEQPALVASPEAVQDAKPASDSDAKPAVPATRRATANFPKTAPGTNFEAERAARQGSPRGAGSGQPSEARLLSAARALVESEPRRALALLQEHQQLYPAGVLSQEREVLRVRALRVAGKAEAAHEAAETFRKNHPDSVHHMEE